MVFTSGTSRFKPLIVLGFTLLILLGATTIQGIISPHPAPALWQVTGERGSAYLLTALSVGNEDFYPLDARIETIFAQSNNLVVTVDLTKIEPEKLNTAIMAEALYPDGRTVADELSPAELFRCEEVFTGFGIALDQLVQFRPWFLMVMTEALHHQTIGYFSDQNLDVYFLNKAAGKRIIGLEDPLEQATLFAQLPPETQKMLLLEALNTDFPQTTGELVTAWWNGDLDKLEAIIFPNRPKSAAYLDYYEKIYFSRNRRMAKQIGDFLATDGSYFILLPCGHFLGTEGIISLLQTQGYNVERVKFKD